MNRSRLNILWLSADKRAAADMALLYARDSLLNGWFDEVQLILWGPTVQTAAEDRDIQTEFELLRHLGCEIKACKACAIRYGVVKRLSELGITVDGMGEELTKLLRSCEPLMLI